MQVNLEMVRHALATIRQYMPESVCENSLYYYKEGHRVAMKLECNNLTRSFKIRGAINKIASLNEKERRAGVITVSSGNHGAGVSLASRLINLPAPPVVVVPATTPLPKLERIKAYGGNVVQHGKNYDEANAHAQEIMIDKGMTFIDACSDPWVIAGQGSIALELMDAIPGMDAVLVPIGGGGMASGVAAAVKAAKPEIKVFGVQTKACPAMVRSLADDICYEAFPNDESICDALIGGIGPLPFEMVGKYIDDIIVVSEEDIAEAVRNIFLSERIVAEPAGAISFAAASEKYLGGEYRSIAVVISGGNITTDLFQKIVFPRQ
jgi:threonine dehydratase